MLKIILLVFSIALIFSCTYFKMKRNLDLDFTTPISTLKFFRQAILKNNWSMASQCFSDEIREKNSNFLNLRKMYTISYWTPSRGVESIMNEFPTLIEKEVSFKLVSSNAGLAIVKLVYPKYREKAVRLHSLKLEKKSGEWRIAEVFGETKGHFQ